MNPQSQSVCAVARVLALSALAWIFVCGPAAADRAIPGVVQGVVWNSDNSPISQGKVRLRNLESGRIVAAGETTQTGQFIFGEVVQSLYLVELVSDTGKVLAVGPSFHVGSGQTVSTVVRVPARRSWYSGMFSNAAAGVIAAASTAGLAAVGSQNRPISPQ